MLNKESAIEIFIKYYSDSLQRCDNEEIKKYVKHKLTHTLQVLSATQRLISTEKTLSNFSKDFKSISELNAIFHDLGRFEQHNGSKVLSIDHGNKSYGILRREGINDLKILLPVKYHNKKIIDPLYQDEEYVNASQIEKDQITIFAKLLRDSDKLDNMEYFIFNFDRIKFIFDNYLSDGEYENVINDIVMDTFSQKVIVGNENVKSFLDYFVSMLSRIFDINFSGTRKYLKLIGYSYAITDKMKNDYGIGTDIISKLKKISDESLNQ